jgi:hypothetical protein
MVRDKTLAEYLLDFAAERDLGTTESLTATGARVNHW